MGSSEGPDRHAGNRRDQDMAGIKVMQSGREWILEADPGENLLKLLRKKGFFIPAACGGNGTCGKCRVTYRLQGQEFTGLACRTEAEEGMEVFLQEWSEDDIVTEGVQSVETKNLQKIRGIRNPDSPGGGKGRYSVAVDLGTTTIAAALIRKEDEDARKRPEVIERQGAWNRQAAYGADVISRIQYIMEHPGDGLDTLKNEVRAQTAGMVREMCSSAGIDVSQIDDVFVSGNTIMEHIFCGVSPVSIAAAPFTPETLFLTDGSSNNDVYELALGDDQDREKFCVPVHMAPCVSGYVGGDIVSGLTASGIAEDEGIGLFLDIGTNGEMAIGGKHGFLCCAVASGPAFEGAQITCGMAASRGAVSAVSWKDGRIQMEVIGGGRPKGICGSGLTDLLAMLLEVGAVDESGCFLSPEEAEEEGAAPEVLPYLSEDEDGNGVFWISREDQVCFTAQDVRKLQLAKAAIAAGIDVLLKESGITAAQADRLYIAGGFGRHLNLRSASIIGMFPAELEEKAVYAGNASLLGTERACGDFRVFEKMQKVQAECRYLELSGNRDFNDAYIEHMMFGNGEREEED